MKVRIKKEIVTIGDPSINPTILSGDYVKPENWNELISDPDVIVIDTRNAYETKIGKFKNAIDPKTNSFREFPDWVKKFKEEVEQKLKMEKQFLWMSKLVTKFCLVSGQEQRSKLTVKNTA